MVDRVHRVAGRGHVRDLFSSWFTLGTFMKYNRVLFEQLHPHWSAGKDAKGRYEDPRMQQSYETWSACKRATLDTMKRSAQRYTERGQLQKAAVTVVNRQAVMVAI
jgi:hypothetical protein